MRLDHLLSRELTTPQPSGLPRGSDGHEPFPGRSHGQVPHLSPRLGFPFPSARSLPTAQVSAPLSSSLRPPHSRATACVYARRYAAEGRCPLPRWRGRRESTTVVSSVFDKRGSSDPPGNPHGASPMDAIVTSVSKSLFHLVGDRGSNSCGERPTVRMPAAAEGRGDWGAELPSVARPG